MNAAGVSASIRDLAAAPFAVTIACVIVIASDAPLLRQKTSITNRAWSWTGSTVSSSLRRHCRWQQAPLPSARDTLCDELEAELRCSVNIGNRHRPPGTVQEALRKLITHLVRVSRRGDSGSGQIRPIGAFQIGELSSVLNIEEIPGHSYSTSRQEFFSFSVAKASKVERDNPIWINLDRVNISTATDAQVVFRVVVV